ncbi:hypothetical protein JAAARDRAFT_418897 [Jaapia argillacea MUCL 33604]|uniref:FHA domain-containing protein n=1 Tax=Jaapia argillacea MUCL 33604 TaxID=933084 RepID=A0A067PRN3_9AGAM|nr:hypothetical protein JAAARDRAFT_418897 [Jaapia argillacea MUCL 33604]
MIPLFLFTQRHHILGFFLRRRPRGTSSSKLQLQLPNQQPHSPYEDQPHSPREDQPQSPVPSPPSPGPEHGTSPAAVAAGGIQASVSQNSGQVQQGQPQAQSSGCVAAGLAQTLRRTRSAGALPMSGAAQAASATSPNPNGATHTFVPALSAIPRSNLTPPQTGTTQSYRIRLVPQVDTIRFDPISRDLKLGDAPLRIGRFTDSLGSDVEVSNALGSNKLVFKSKVVSRSHAEIWVEGGGRWWIKDTKSASGTFLRRVRLSPAGTESRVHEIRDGGCCAVGYGLSGRGGGYL